MRPPGRGTGATDRCGGPSPPGRSAGREASSTRTCVSCGKQWYSLYAEMKHMFSPFAQVSVTDPGGLLGLSCVLCGKSLCRKCLGTRLPRRLPGGKCRWCGGQLNL